MIAISFGCPECGGIGGDCRCPIDEADEADRLAANRWRI